MVTFFTHFGVKTMFYIFLERLLAKNSPSSAYQLQKQELINDFKICSPNKMHVINLGFDLKRFADDGSKRRQLIILIYQMRLCCRYYWENYFNKRP